MKEQAVSIRQDKQSFVLSDGTRVTLTAYNPLTDTTPGEVALHEAAHIVAEDGRILFATIIPDSDALGKTVPVGKPSLAGAGAAAGIGLPGADHDLRIAYFLYGATPEQAKAAGRRKLAGQEDYVYAVAADLEENKTVNGKDIAAIQQHVTNLRRGIRDVNVVVEGSDGGKEVYTTESANNIVLLPGEWFLLTVNPDNLN